MTDDGTAEREEGLMNVGAAFVANPQAAELVQPTEGAFHDPARLAQPASMRRSRACQLVGDPTLPQPPMMCGATVSAIPLHGLWSLAWTADLAPHGRNRRHERLQLAAVMDVGPRQLDAQRQAFGCAAK